MTNFLELTTIAFFAQLAVLPGEKGQLVVAGLATRYHPLLVVAAAASAFAGWTALEIAFGAALQGALPTVALDAISGVLFCTFAILLVRSAPAEGTDVGVDRADASAERDASSDGDVATDNGLDVSLLGYEVPPALGGFLPIFVLMGVGEFGDKTQLVTIGLAIEYGARPAIWAGEMAAIVPVSLVNAYLFDRFAHRVDARAVYFLAAALFAFFALDAFVALVTGAVLGGEAVSIWEWVVAVFAEWILGQAAVV